MAESSMDEHRDQAKGKHGELGGGPERMSDERSEDDMRGGTAPNSRRTQGGVPDPEVFEKPERRKFSIAYKLKILDEVDAATESGQIGAVLRREGLYSSHLSKWRQQRDRGQLSGGSGAPQPGRKSEPRDASAVENARLRRENERLARRLEQAEAIIDAQKKIAEILGTHRRGSIEKDDLDS